jgi:hypothetical protein
MNETLHISACIGHHQKATNISKGIIGWFKIVFVKKQTVSLLIYLKSYSLVR